MTTAIKANQIANQEFTLSSMINKLRNKADGEAKDNFIRQAWDVRKADDKFTKEVQDNIEKLEWFIQDKAKYRALCTLLGKIWNVDRKAGATDKTYNLKVNIIDNKGRCSAWTLFAGLVSLAKREDFNKIYNAANRLKPLKSKEKAAATA